ncbi:hypothetical protein [Metabacillus litoralis]|uniref:hypothetical protein n=1 Tax=Metabacillus litoralis TaxID=152268 RepID=UPI000EF5E50B|nr:hypothetical protein [Metabacillus litoralis]
MHSRKMERVSAMGMYVFSFMLFLLSVINMASFLELGYVAIYMDVYFCFAGATIAISLLFYSELIFRL